MGFLKRLSSLFAPSPSSRSGNLYPLTVKCNRCGEIIQGQINIANDLSVGDGDAADAGGYYCRKLLMGKQRCFQQIEVILKFDGNRRIVDRQIMGGEFVDES
jgi:hypothetical protein